MDDTDRRGLYPGRVTIQRMDHVGIVVDDLAATTAFFVELGLEREGEATLESLTVDRRVTAVTRRRVVLAQLEPSVPSGVRIIAMSDRTPSIGQ